MLDLLRDAADHELMVTFHSCPTPKGWDHTWPNLMSTEAVTATEHYKDFNVAHGDRMPEQMVNVAFIRNTIGSDDVSAGDFDASLAPANLWTSYAHELALNVILGTGLHVGPDSPAAYRFGGAE